MVTLRVPAGVFRADRTVPGDKSLSHRALILAAMAQGVSRVRGIGPGEDVAATQRALAALGVDCRGQQIRSPGINSWRAPDRPIDAANSASTLRLLAGALAARPFRTTLVGDASLMSRPMDHLAAGLRALGASVGLGPDGRPPVTVGTARLHGARVELPVASAQVRSAVALAALQADGPSIIMSPPGFRDHTERWLESMGRGRRLPTGDFVVQPGPVGPGVYSLPGDLSSAAFLLAAGALRPGSRITVRGVTLNPGRTGFLDVLDAMGVRVRQRITAFIHGDPVGDVSVRTHGLRAARVTGALATRALDELPLVGLLGSAAAGETLVSGARELRTKESDRAAATVRLLRSLGGMAEELPDGFLVTGTGGLVGGEVDAAGDHRIAMTAAVAAVVAPAGVSVRGLQAVGVSWPGFVDALEGLWS